MTSGRQPGQTVERRARRGMRPLDCGRAATGPGGGYAQGQVFAAECQCTTNHWGDVTGGDNRPGGGCQRRMVGGESTTRMDRCQGPPSGGGIDGGRRHDSGAEWLMIRAWPGWSENMPLILLRSWSAPAHAGAACPPRQVPVHHQSAACARLVHGCCSWSTPGRCWPPAGTPATAGGVPDHHQLPPVHLRMMRCDGGRRTDGGLVVARAGSPAWATGQHGRHGGTGTGGLRGRLQHHAWQVAVARVQHGGRPGAVRCGAGGASHRRGGAAAAAKSDSQHYKQNLKAAIGSCCYIPSNRPGEPSIS